MTSHDRNFYRVDDVLLRVGGMGLVAVLLLGGLGLLFANAVSADESLPPGYTGFLIAQYAFAYVALLLFPVVTLRVGWSMRQRERRIGAIWQLLQQHAQVSVDDLLANSHFTPQDIERAIKLLNTRGLGHYVWDRESGTLQDGRLRTTQLLVEKCEACGGSISLAVPIGSARAPSCPFCGDPVCVDALEERRREVLDELRAQHAPAKPARPVSAVPFSIPLFVVLLISFWPAALGYAWYKSQVGSAGNEYR